MKRFRDKVKKPARGRETWSQINTKIVGQAHRGVQTDGLIQKCIRPLNNLTSDSATYCTKHNEAYKSYL